MPRRPARLAFGLLPLCLAAALGAHALPAVAEGRIPSHCIALAGPVEGMAGLVPAAFGAPLDAAEVRISYVEHATFLIEAAGGPVAATDYTGYLGAADPVPDVATMNHAHSTHWTPAPDPRIPHVLEGWGGVAHHLDLGGMLVRNVSTDIRRGGGVEPAGNSIFVFEAAGLCIGHLGHLHHEPTPAQYAMLGRMDVVMAPVDGGPTLDLPTMLRVLARLRASVVIPMHWFGEGSLSAFLAGMDEDFDLRRSGESFLEIGLHDLPSRPTVIVLAPRRID